MRNSSGNLNRRMGTMSPIAMLTPVESSSDFERAIHFQRSIYDESPSSSDADDDEYPHPFLPQPRLIRWYRRLCFACIVLSLRLWMCAFLTVNVIGVELVVSPLLIQAVLAVMLAVASLDSTSIYSSHRPSRQRMTVLVYCWWSVIDVLATLIVSALLVEGAEVVLTEPHGHVTTEWHSLYAAFYVIVVLNAVSAIVSTAACLTGLFVFRAACFRCIHGTQTAKRKARRSDTEIQYFTIRGRKKYRAVIWFGCAVVTSINLYFGLRAPFNAAKIYFGLGREEANWDDVSTCDPIDPSMCILPFPSVHFLEPDSKTDTGYRMSLSPHTLPSSVSPDKWNRGDGFSVSAPILFHLANNVSPSGFPNHQNIEASVTDKSNTILLRVDSSSGKLSKVPHFVDIDEVDGDDLRLILLQPAVQLEHGTRYIVGVRGAATPAGQIIPTSDAFHYLKDPSRGNKKWDSMREMRSRAERYSLEVFPHLEWAGFSLDELQLGWDFVTASRSSTLGLVEALRDHMVSLVGEHGPEYEIISVENHVSGKECSGPVAAIENRGPGARLFDPEGNILSGDADEWVGGRAVWGRAKVPLYLQGSHRGSELEWSLIENVEVGEGAGRKVIPRVKEDIAVPMTWMEFAVFIPCSVLVDPGLSQVVQYGHSLLSSRAEIEDSYLREMANKFRFILIAADFRGMSRPDMFPLIKVVGSKLESFNLITDAVMQGMVQQEALAILATTGLPKDPSMMSGKVPLVDPTSKPVYYGNSQGSILGGGFFGMSSHIEKAVLGVPGAVFAMVLGRSVDFGLFFKLFRLQLPDLASVRVILSLSQILWDPVEGGGWLNDLRLQSLERSLPRDTSPWPTTQLVRPIHLTTNTTLSSLSSPEDGPDSTSPSTLTLTGNDDGPTIETPRHEKTKQVLLQSVANDPEVSELAAHYMARTLDIATVFRNPRPVFGLFDEAAPFVGSALAEWMYRDAGEIPFGNVPPKRGPSEVHECVRREPDAQLQLFDFVTTGTVRQYCDGQCIRDSC